MLWVKRDAHCGIEAQVRTEGPVLKVVGGHLSKWPEAPLKVARGPAIGVADTTPEAGESMMIKPYEEHP